jgi:hypothetical protein
MLKKETQLLRGINIVFIRNIEDTSSAGILQIVADEEKTSDKDLICHISDILVGPSFIQGSLYLSNYFVTSVKTHTISYLSFAYIKVLKL